MEYNGRKVILWTTLLRVQKQMSYAGMVLVCQQCHHWYETSYGKEGTGMPNDGIGGEEVDLSVYN